jgi:hypothetical protein
MRAPSAAAGTRHGTGAPLALRRLQFHVQHPFRIGEQREDIVMSVAVTQPDGAGFFRAWAVASAMPNASFLNFVTGQTAAVTTVVPVLPGAGSGFSLSSAGANAHAVIDVAGCFAAPVANALDCTVVQSAIVAVPNNSWTAIDATCPAGRTATGGGYDTNDGSLGHPGVWLTSVPLGTSGWRVWVDHQTGGNRNMFSFATCCRIPGR